MGAQHSGAAEAASLLRTSRSSRDMTGLHLPSGSLPGSVPATLAPQSGEPAGFGLQTLPEHVPGYQVASSDLIPGPASVPRFGVGVPFQMTGPPDESSVFEPGRPPAARLFGDVGEKQTDI
jgi:hypothetical protein